MDFQSAQFVSSHTVKLWFVRSGVTTTTPNFLRGTARLVHDSGAAMQLLPLTKNLPDASVFKVNLKYCNVLKVIVKLYFFYSSKSSAPHAS